MWHGVSSVLSTHKYQVPSHKIQSPGRAGTPDLCTPVLSIFLSDNLASYFRDSSRRACGFLWNESLIGNWSLPTSECKSACSVIKDPISDLNCVHRTSSARGQTDRQGKASRWIFRRIANRHYYLRHVCPSVCTGQLGTHWTDFHEIWHLRIFRKSVLRV